ncbi:MAG: response regulator [Motiliproteus sp.]|nr:response regulator [Motiliproteus sp.]MCW9053987.1 response regulator [Motiliproteus sp.]
MESDTERTLLLVDDEENILRSLRRLFRREGYKIYTANGGAEGLKVLSENPIGVIVSDQRMPEMTGSEFLHQVKELYPDTVRIILSGYTDLESVTESINIGAVYKFLTKPWDDELLCEHVREAFRIFELNAENQRLTNELQLANQELENRVEKKTRQLRLNIQALTVSQDILEELPLMVLGISEGEVIVANRRAREILTESPLLIGMPLEEVSPLEFLNLYQQSVELGGEITESEFTISDVDYICSCHKNSSAGAHEGYIITLREKP